MRIIGGKARGRPLRAPRGSGTRPTSARVREALFSMIEARVTDLLGDGEGALCGLRVLDLFAGSGALGLEALSRGAASATFVEQSSACARLVSRNAAETGLAAGCRVIAAPARGVLVRLAREGARFELVLLDPPYALDPLPVVRKLLQAELLAPGGLLALEHAPRKGALELPGLRLIASRRHGDSALSLYTRSLQAGPSDLTNRAGAAITGAHDADRGPRMKRVAIYPGSFDPVTHGHLDVVQRALAIFDHVVVAVANNINKRGLFDAEERGELLREVLDGWDRVEVDIFSGLLVDYVSRRGAGAIVRGLRAVADFEYEFQLALMNRQLAPTVDTIFLMTDEKYFYVSSSLVREVALFGGDVAEFVPEPVGRALKKKLAQKQ